MSEDQLLVTPNFTQTQDRVEPGIYNVRITDSKIETWKSKDGKKDTTAIAWTLTTFSEAEEKNNGRKIFHRTAIEGPGAFRLQDLYKVAVGVECSGPFDRSTLYGAELEVTLAPQRDKPEFTEVKSIKPISH